MTTSQFREEVDTARATLLRISSDLDGLARFMETVPSTFVHLPGYPDMTVTDLASKDDEGDVPAFELSARHLFQAIKEAGRATEGLRARSADILWGDPFDRPCTSCGRRQVEHASGKPAQGHVLARPDRSTPKTE